MTKKKKERGRHEILNRADAGLRVISFKMCTGVASLQAGSPGDQRRMSLYLIWEPVRRYSRQMIARRDLSGPVEMERGLQKCR